MFSRFSRKRTFLLIFLFILAPIAAVVLITLLLTIGVRPALVFAPGHAVLGVATRLGFHAPKAVGVITTGLAWWAGIAAVGYAWEAAVRRSR